MNSIYQATLLGGCGLGMRLASTPTDIYDLARNSVNGSQHYSKKNSATECVDLVGLLDD